MGVLKIGGKILVNPQQGSMTYVLTISSYVYTSSVNKTCIKVILIGCACKRAPLSWCRSLHDGKSPCVAEQHEAKEIPTRLAYLNGGTIAMDRSMQPHPINCDDPHDAGTNCEKMG